MTLFEMAILFEMMTVSLSLKVFLSEMMFETLFVMMLLFEKTIVNLFLFEMMTVSLSDLLYLSEYVFD